MPYHWQGFGDFVFLQTVFDDQTDEEQIINHLLKPYTETFACQKLFMFVRGNHETRSKYAVKQYFANIDHDHYFPFAQAPVFNTVYHLNLFPYHNDFIYDPNAGRSGN